MLQKDAAVSGWHYLKQRARGMVTHCSPYIEFFFFFFKKSLFSDNLATHIHYVSLPVIPDVVLYDQCQPNKQTQKQNGTPPHPPKKHYQQCL